MQLTMDETRVLSRILENSQYGFKVNKETVTLPNINIDVPFNELVSLNQKMVMYLQKNKQR